MILVFGRNGQVATELGRHADVTTLGRDEVDLMTQGAAQEAVARHAPNAVINAAAWTAVDKAEEEESAAYRLNAEAPAEMARACAARGIPFVHISTDYVFDGQGDRPFDVDDPTSPLGAYGRTKLAGEDAVRAAEGTYAILRTSWVVSAHGNNFVKTMLRLSETRDRLTIVSDQIGGPTCARDIASACLDIAGQLRTDPTKSGTYHFSGGPDVSWANFARAIFDKTGRTVDVVDIPSSDYPTPAARPLNSRLNNSRTQEVFGIDRPDWESGLGQLLHEVSASKSG